MNLLSFSMSDYNTWNYIDPVEFFGKKNALRLSKAMRFILRCSFGHKYDGCDRTDTKARESRDKELEKAFKTVYGIAKRKKIFIEWQGIGAACYPDRWVVYKRKKELAYIQL